MALQERLGNTSAGVPEALARFSGTEESRDALRRLSIYAGLTDLTSIGLSMAIGYAAWPGNGCPAHSC